MTTSGRVSVSMTNKLLGILAVVLLIASCNFLAGSSANPVVISSPTPSPTPTTEPTVTPIPTPRPEPSAKPTLEMYCKSNAVESKLKVTVTGTLTYNKTAIPSASIYLSYSADSGNRWENFSLVQTRADGGFGALWIPNATGNYFLNAQWEGNSTLHWMNTTVILALMPDSEGNVFSAASNSTISSFDYDSLTQVISFNTNGKTSTTGYIHVCVPKTLVSDTQTIKVNIDGKPITFTSESQDDVWVISCVYTQSQHAFTIQIPFVQTLSPATTPWIAIVIVIVILIALVATAIVIRRRRRTAATVASILKHNRPLN